MVRRSSKSPSLDGTPGRARFGSLSTQRRADPKVRLVVYVKCPHMWTFGQIAHSWMKRKSLQPLLLRHHAKVGTPNAKG
jgi:hypothetical protein